MKIKVKNKEALAKRVEYLINQIEAGRASGVAEVKDFYRKKRESLFGKLFYDEMAEADELFIASSYASVQYNRLLLLRKTLKSEEIDEVWLDEKQAGWLL